ncbi:hypothetical protein FGADI_12584 [Fusarium gaditjirri]|uniref:Protein kinase domain-containing protein n=1 Tax=Fusarium gaditjirri TaxID=282569 RepID=A0A8H4SRV1_9HYPO|nr:hypothetical protein FGADI_12584 [Fusarium gaditjirri]
MAEGFVGLAFGVSGVFTVVDQCLTLYRHIDEARDFGENVWQQYVLFKHECTRFHSWQKEMRDFHVFTTAQQPQPTQQRSFSTEMGLPSADEQMHDILTQIIVTLETVRTLCKKYKVDQAGQHGRTTLKKADVTSISTGLATTIIGSAVASDGKMGASSIKKQQNEAFLKANTGLFKRIFYGAKLWKEPDKEEFEKCVKDFAHWNNCLQDFFPSTRRMLLDLVSSSAILEMEQDPQNLKRIQAAASTGLYDSLARRAALRQENLDQEPKSSTKEDVDSLDEKEVGYTLSTLRGVVTFSNTSADSLGYVQYEEQEHRLFGFISAFPPKSDCNQPPLSLSDLLVDGTKHKRSYSLPSLPQRLRIAQRVTITLLELHNSEWLHKDLNSRNVLFFYGTGTVLNLSMPYVSGFEYTRPDNISAISFSVRSSPTDIYRHPGLLGPFPAHQTRPRYKRVHDIYSLGLLLLEISL